MIAEILSNTIQHKNVTDITHCGFRITFLDPESGVPIAHVMNSAAQNITPRIIKGDLGPKALAYLNNTLYMIDRRHKIVSLNGMSERLSKKNLHLLLFYWQVHQYCAPVLRLCFCPRF